MQGSDLSRTLATTDQTIDLLRCTAINNIKTAVAYLNSAVVCLEGGVTWDVDKMLEESGKALLLAGGNAKAALLCKIVLGGLKADLEERLENQG